MTLTPHSLLMPWFFKGRAILVLLLPLWAIWPVQSLSACTRVQFMFFTFLIVFHFEICGTRAAVGLKPDFSESWAHFEYNIYLNLFSN